MKILGYLYFAILLFSKIFYRIKLYSQRSYLLIMGVQLGNSVKIGKRVHFILEKNSTLVLGNKVTISDDCWIIVHENSTLEIGENTFISHHCVLSSNTNVRIGKYTAIGPYSVILDTDKNYKDPSTLIRNQGSTSEPICIGDDVWLGAFSMITKGVSIGIHSVIAAHSVVTKDIDGYSLNAGNPSKKIKAIKEYS